VGAHAIYTRIFQKGFNEQYEIEPKLEFFGFAAPGGEGIGRGRVKNFSQSSAFPV
jgi:hypothetical protein